MAFVKKGEEDTTLLSDPEWLLDPAFFTGVTEKINLQLQNKDAVKAFNAKLSLYKILYFLALLYSQIVISFYEIST